MPNGDSEKSCVLGNNNRTRIEGLEHERDNIWHAMDEVRAKLDRLPAWATVLLMVLMGVIGVLGTLVVT